MNKARELMKRIAVGDTVLLLGKPVVVVENTVDWWDDEYIIPSLRVAYYDDGGRYTTTRLSPQECVATIKEMER